VPLDLDKVADEPGSNAPDSATKLEEEDLDKQKQKAQIAGLLQDIAERKKYAGRIFYLISLWLIGIFLILILQGFGSNSHWFALSEAVVIAAIGGTTINVIGIFIVVAKYLFPKRDSDPN
jgi:hypothetical protein